MNKFNEIFQNGNKMEIGEELNLILSEQSSMSRTGDGLNKFLCKQARFFFFSTAEIANVFFI